jgi:hypothetical protein
LAVTLPAGSFRDTLTIDNPHDIDWIRFRVASLTTVTIKTASVTSATAADTSDVDLFLLTVPGGGASSSLDLLNRSDAGGSTETITTVLGAGEYYLVAVDYQGVPVAYDLCIDSSGCTAFPVAPRSSAWKTPIAAPVRRLAPPP